MALIDWSPALSIGIKSIDDQHKQLVLLVNKLYEAMGVGKGNDVVGPVLDEVIKYTQTHFKNEETLFATHKYKEEGAHKTEHADLVKRVSELHGKIKAGERVSPITTGQFLKEWLAKHIQVSDKAYAPYLIEKGVK